MKRLLTTQMLYGCIFSICLLLTAVSSSVAQSTGSRGKDFWLAFMPNFHTNAHSSNPRMVLEDSLYIYIAATAPTKVTINYRDRAGTPLDSIINIVDITKVYNFSLPWLGFEIEGFNDSGVLFNSGQNETPAPQTFHVTSEKDISVYALNQARTTSDAFLVLPTPVLGIDHFIMSYNSDGTFERGDLSGASTPSQFVVVATQDNTQLIITPKVPTYISGMSVKNVTLNAGQAFLVQSRVSSSNLTSDLTGSRVVSSKPVAVFAGHQRATLPIEFRASLTSRDCLIEQIPSLEVWGKSAFLVPYPVPNGASPIGSDLFRVMAAMDSTPVTLNGNLIAMLNAGDFFTGALTSPGTLTSTKPILVAQFKKTSGEPSSQGGGGLRLGDPFMMLIPPAEQFLTFYRCINAQAWEVPSPDIPIASIVYREQYITVVAPNSAVSTVRIDGNVVAPATFRPIQGSAYSFAWVSVSDGSHTVEAAEPIGIYVYGYGLANSYGYVGDMDFHAFDYRPPELVSTIKCNEIHGIWYDSTRGDTRLLSVTAPPDSQVNMQVNIEPFTPYRDSVTFTARLLDEYQDGVLTIKAEDSAGLTSSSRIQISGFTLRAEQAILPSPSVEITSDAPLRKYYCLPVSIINYGGFPKTITKVQFRNAGTQFYTPTSFPITIPPGGTSEISVCFFTSVPDVYRDTMDIVNDCGERTVATFRYKAVPDSLPPVVTRTDNPCGTEFIFDISDALPSDLGIQNIELVSPGTKNCSIITDIQSNGQIAKSVIKVDNIYEDAFFLLRITDSAGNTRLFSDTIPGLTVTISSLPEPSDGTVDFGNPQLKTLVCDTVTIYNYGIFPLKFNQISPIKNILFSTPQTQFPITLSPGERLPLIICYSPVEVKATPDFDTLRFGLRCLSRDFPLRGTAETILRDGPTRCDISIVSRSVTAPTSFFFDQTYPNPVHAGEPVALKFGIPETTDTYLALYDLQGVRRAELISGRTAAGIYTARLVTDGLPAGFYCCVLKTNGAILTQTLIIQ